MANGDFCVDSEISRFCLFETCGSFAGPSALCCSQIAWESWQIVEFFWKAVTFAPAKALIKKMGLLVSFIIPKHPWEPKSQCRNEKQDDPTRLSAVARQPLMLALRPSQDRIGMEIRGDVLKTTDKQVWWCSMGQETWLSVFNGAVGGWSWSFSSPF